MRVHHLNHRGSLAQVTTYLNLMPAEIFPHPLSRWGSGIVSRFLLAAFVALFDLGHDWLALTIFFANLVLKHILGAALVVALYTPHEVIHGLFLPVTRSLSL
jgi:hypothetical protein